MRKVLAIAGKRFHGKDTFATMVIAHARRHGREVAPFAFAAESKRMFVDAQRAAGVEVDLARLQTDRTYKEEWRPKLTEFTVSALACDPSVFVREVARRIEASHGPSMITDLRLRLELEHLRPRFALHVVRLARSDEHRLASGWQWKPGVDDHHTETELDDQALWDEVITNEGSEAELSKKAAEVVSAWLG